MPQIGVWEVRKSKHPSARKVNRQVMINPPVAWCQAGTTPINMGGNYNRSFTPQNKLSEKVVEDWYKKPMERIAE